MVQWFPGHMAKAHKEIEDHLKLVDIVYELIDARIPLSSQNPIFNDIIKQKKKLVIVTKTALADPVLNRFWQTYFAKANIPALFVDSITGTNVSKIVAQTHIILSEKRTKDLERGMKPRPVRAMIIGIPNVGKSTLINQLVSKKVATVGDKPGVTKAQQWIRIHSDLELLDTPGVLWPKFVTQTQGFHLALTGAIKDEILHKEDIIFYLLDFLNQFYPNAYQFRYGITPQATPLDTLTAIALSRGLHRQQEIDYERTYDLILNDFKSGRLGRITLDRGSYVYH